MNLETALNEMAELVRSELHIVRKRAEEKTPARDHGHDFHDTQQSAPGSTTSPTRCAGYTIKSSAPTGAPSAPQPEDTMKAHNDKTFQAITEGKIGGGGFVHPTATHPPWRGRATPARCRPRRPQRATDSDLETAALDVREDT
jgi:hypothetical protein